MQPVSLTTPRLLLRAFTPADAEAVFAACQDPEIQRWTTVPSPYGRADAEGFTGAYTADGWADGTAYTFGVFAGPGAAVGAGAADAVAGGTAGAGAAEGELLGACGLMATGGPGLLELGYWAVREHRGRGYLTEAAGAVCDWGFDRFAPRRITWRAQAGNTASRAVAEKLGFRFEGTLRAHLLHRGEVYDEWIAGLLPGDRA